MSWIEKLYKTYDNNRDSIGKGSPPLIPLYHTIQNAQVQIVLGDAGNLIRVAAISKEDAPTMIPATEESAGRSGSKMAPHPLCDTLQYVAGDYVAWGGNPNKKKNESGYELYIESLRAWVNWSQNKKLASVLKYLEKKTLIGDLVARKLFFGDANGRLLEVWNGVGDVPPIFKTIKLANKKGQYEAFVRVSVEIPGEIGSDLWKDAELQQSWCNYYPTTLKDETLCMVTGERTKRASNHPKYIRYPGDGAKLISSNDTQGFTYLGRFTNDREACGVGIDVTQKAHNALRWLIARQGRRDGDQAIVAWAVSGIDVPDPIADTFSMLFKGQEEAVKRESEYTAQEIGEALKKLIVGYSAKIGATEDVLIMGLDSATPGRMAVSFYRELTGSEFFQRVMAWHDLNNGCVWRQYFGKDRIFVGAPAPRDIAECAYGRRLDEKLRKATIERLLPCIVDGLPIPRDLVESCVRKASNRSGLEYWEYEKALGIACALYKYHNKERNYTMTLEVDRKTRDYLYGRLLAAADSLESLALWLAKENRPTNAARMMQRFADHPCSTWRTIELSLAPYKARLGGRAHKQLASIDEIMSGFKVDEFAADTPLTGEFLLGYHTQRAAFHAHNDQSSDDANNEQETIQ